MPSLGFPSNITLTICLQGNSSTVFRRFGNAFLVDTHLTIWLEEDESAWERVF